MPGGYDMDGMISMIFEPNKQYQRAVSDTKGYIVYRRAVYRHDLDDVCIMPTGFIRYQQTECCTAWLCIIATVHA